MAQVTVNVKGTLDKAIQQKLAQVNNPSTMVAIHNTLAKKCDPYVPFLNGPLSQTNVVSAEGVRYIQPYARYQYYGTDFNFTRDYHPLASAQWDKAMLRDYRAEFIEEVRDIIRWRIQKADG